MTKTYSCSSVGCGATFLKAYELKKHLVTHEDPAKVFRCPQCNFITLQKKNLGIHLAIHTGEKTHRCPHPIKLSLGSPDVEEICSYRTNDPAALTKHRKKVHGYVPPPNRRRPQKDIPTSRPSRPNNVDLSRSPLVELPAQHLCRTLLGITDKADIPGSATAHRDLSDQSVAIEHSLSACQEKEQAPSRHSVESNVSDTSNAPPLNPLENMRLDPHYDPSLNVEWMVNYEQSYTTFDGPRLEHPRPMRTGPSPVLAHLDLLTGREGCLCPEWMVEAGVEGWTQDMADVHEALCHI